MNCEGNQDCFLRPKWIILSSSIITYLFKMPLSANQLTQNTYCEETLQQGDEFINLNAPDIFNNRVCTVYA